MVAVVNLLVCVVIKQLCVVLLPRMNCKHRLTRLLKSHHVLIAVLALDVLIVVTVAIAVITSDRRW